MALGTNASVTASFTDVGTLDTHTCAYAWGDATTSTGAAAAGVCTATHVYTAPGVYAVDVTVTDDDGGSATKRYEYIVVYDPNAGFVTGGGFIESAAGAYVADPTLVGRANFGFVAKYKKGATVPDGQTQFQFQAASFNFHSIAYQWLVVSGAKAQFKGTGAVNGTEGYGFLLTVTDGQLSGGGGADRFRLKVWSLSSGAVVYDNVLGAPDDLSAVPQAIAQGSIVIHTGK